VSWKPVVYVLESQIVEGADWLPVLDAERQPITFRGRGSKAQALTMAEIVRRWPSFYGVEVEDVIGEHTSANCPWRRALELADEHIASAADPIAAAVDAQFAELRPQLIEAGHKYADPYSLRATGEEPR
jgi:hypothetical protein